MRGFFPPISSFTAGLIIIMNIISLSSLLKMLLFSCLASFLLLSEPLVPLRAAAFIFSAP